MKVDYIAIMQKYYGRRRDGFLTDVPRPIQFSEDDYIKVRYDAQTMRWIPNRPSKIKYPTAKQLIREYRQEYAKKIRCVICNSTELIENHHIIPKADGGSDDIIPLCRNCHLRLHGINGDFRGGFTAKPKTLFRWTSAWHQYYREVDPEGYREHQRKAGRARQAQLRRLLGKAKYREYQRRLAMRRNGQAW